MLDSKRTKITFRWILRILIYSNLIAIFVIPMIFDATSEYQIGKWAGTLSALVFLSTQLTGVFRRFELSRIFKQLGNLLLFNRAHLGVLMFLLATIHYELLFLLPTIAYGFIQPKPFVIFGILAFYATFPLFVTSNNWSKKKLKKNWGRLHRLAYAILWLIFLHTAMQSVPLISALILMVGILQMGSLVYARFATSKKLST